MTSDKGIGLSSFLSPLVPDHVVLPLHTQAITGLSQGQKPLRHLLALLSISRGAQGVFTPSRIHAGWLSLSPAQHIFTLPHSLIPLASIPTDFLLCSPALVYFEDLTGISAVHSFHINPLCREEFCPSQVINSNEFCLFSAIQQMTSLPSVLAAAQ